LEQAQLYYNFSDLSGLALSPGRLDKKIVTLV
jgi:hypothetical protein